MLLQTGTIFDKTKAAPNVLTTNNAAVFKELEIDSYIRHKKKHKRKNSELNCGEVYTYPIVSEFNSAASKIKKHKQYKDNCGKSNIEICTNSKKLQIISRNLKSAYRDCDSNKIESDFYHNNSGSNSATNSKNYKENSDLIPIANIVLDDNELISTNKHKKQPKENNYLSSSNDALSTGNHLDINSKELRDSESDFTSVQTCTVIDENETSNKHKKSHSATIDSCSIFDVAYRRKSKESVFTKENFADFGELVIDSNVRHEKIKNSYLNCDEAYTHPINSKLNNVAKKRRKHKKYKYNCSESGTENCTKESQTMSHNHKSKHKDCDSNKIESYSHHNNSGLNCTFYNKSNKKYSDLNTVLDNDKLIPTNKRKKKHKRNKEKSYSNTRTDALSTGNHLNISNIKLNDNKKHNKWDFGIAQTCTVFDKNETASNKHKKKQEKDKNHLDIIDSYSLFNDHKAIPNVACRMKGKENVLTTDNAAVFDELEADSTIRHKGKYKKRKGNGINCDEVYTQLLNTELNHVAKKIKKHKKYFDNYSESNTENCTNSKELQIKSHNHKSAYKNWDSYEVKSFSHHNYPGSSCATKNKSDIIPIADTVLDDNEQIPVKNEKSDFNSVQTCTVFDENKTTSNKHKKKLKKSKSHIATIDSCSIFDDHEAISNVSPRKKSKETGLTTDNVVFDELEREIDSNNRPKKKHKKRKYNDINFVEVDTHPDNSELNYTVKKRRNHKKCKSICDESNSDDCTISKETQITCHNHKSKNTDCGTNYIKGYSHHDTLELSSGSKFINDEEYSDISSTGGSAIFDDNEKNLTVKHKMKHRKSKERDCLNDTDVLSTRNNLDIDNIKLNDIKKHKNSEFNNFQTCTGVDKNETTPNKHKMKWKKDKSHFADSSTPDYLETMYESGFNTDNPTILYELKKDCDITPKKKHKKRKDRDLNCEVYANSENYEINDTDKRKKPKYQGKCNDRNIEICSVFDELEAMSCNKTSKYQKYDSNNIESSIICNNLNYTNNSKYVKENPDFNTIASTDFDDHEIFLGKKHKRNKENHLNTTDALSTVNHLDVNNMQLNCPEKHETHNPDTQRKKHQKVNESDLNCVKVYTHPDTSVLIYTAKKRKKHKKYQDGYDKSNLEACTKESQKLSHNHKIKHQDCDSNDTEAYFDLNTSEFNSASNNIDDKEGPDLNTLASTVLDDSEVIPTKKHKKKHKRNKENTYKTTAETFSDYLSTKNHIDVNNMESKVVEEDTSSNTKNTFNAENHILAKFNEVDAHNNCDQPISHSVYNVEENANEETNYCHIIENNNLSLCLDCNDDPVDFKVPPLHKYETVRNLKEQQRKDFLSQGINIKGGSFTADEDLIIKANYENFVKKYGISDVRELLGIDRYGKNKEISKFIKAKHFYLRLAKGLVNRTLHSIYSRARLILHPLRNADNCTERGITSLIDAQRTLSNKWHKIGDALRKTHPDNSVLNYTAKKRKKHEKYQVGYDESNIEACTKYSKTVCHNHKSKLKDCDSSGIESYFDLNTSQFNSTTNYINDKESLDLNTLASTVLDNNEIITTKKHKKKLKRNKENTYKTTTEIFSDSLSARNHIDINNMESNVVEKDISNSTNNTFNAENYILTKFNEIDALNNCDQLIPHSVDYMEENTNEETNCHIIESNNLTLCLDCNEDPVDFEVPPLHKCETVRNLTEQQRNYFLSQGINIKGGRYTNKEDQIITGNYENFAKKYGISNVLELFGIGRYAKDKEMSKFIKAKHFYLRLAKGLNNRTLHSIYNRARLILHPLRNAYKFSEREITTLINAQRTVSNKWHKIGEALGRTAESCLWAHRYHAKPISKGIFTEEEKQQLIEAIRKVTDSSDLSCKKMKGISWDAVAAYVPTRNFSQCRKYWAKNLAWKPGSAKKKWDDSCYCKLVRILSKEWDVECSTKIDWYKVYESFEDVAPSQTFVQGKWYCLRKRIPDYKNKSYKEIIRILCKKYASKESHKL